MSPSNRSRRLTAAAAGSVMLAVGALAPATVAQRQPTPPIDQLADALLEAAIPAVDDADAMARQLLDAAEANAKSAASTLAIIALSQRAARLRDRDAVLDRLARFVAAGPHGLAAHGANRLRVRLLRMSGRHDDADALDVLASYASHVLAVGPFGDEGDNWVDVVFRPELEFPTKDETLEGRYGSVRAIARKRRPRTPDIRLRPEGSDHDGCYYALHQVRADEAMTVWVELSTTGSFELFVNGRRQAAVDRNEAFTESRHYMAARLGAGTNHVLVKTAQTDSDRISLRYLDAIGRPAAVDEIEATTPQPRVTAANADDANPAPTFVDDFGALAAACRAAGADASRPLQLSTALAAFVRGREPAGLALLLPLLQPAALAQLDARERAGVAHVLGRSNTIPSEIRGGLARQILESAFDGLGDTHHDALMSRVRHLESEDRPEDAIRLLEGHIADGHGGPDTYARLHGLLGRLGFAAEALAVRDAWAEAHPQDNRPLYAQIDGHLNGNDTRGARRTIVAALERLPGDTGLQRRLLRIARELGDRDLAERMRDQLRRVEPTGIAAVRDRAESLRALDGLAASLDAYAELAAHEEAKAGDVRTAGLWLLRGGRPDAAATAFRRALTLDDSQHGIRRLVGRLDTDSADEDADFPLIARFRHSAREVLDGFEPGPREATASASLVLDQMIVRYFPDGSRVEEIHTIRRVNDLAGVDLYDEAPGAADASELVAVRTIAADGTVRVPTRVAGAFSMPRLQPGSFIEEVYREFRDSADPTPRRGPTFYFQARDEPFLWSELVLILPPTPGGEVRTRNFGEQPEVVELDDGYRAFIYRKRDVPRLETEAFTPSDEELLPIASFGEDGSVEAEARSDYAAAVYYTRPTPVVERETARLLDGVDGDRARAERLWQFVHAEIQSGQGYEPTATLMRRQGARYWLFVAMLRAAEIPFRYAIAQSSSEALMAEPPPLFLGDDSYDVHCVRIAPRDQDGAIWAFSDAPRYQPLGEIPVPRRGAALLFLERGRHVMSRLPAGDPGEFAFGRRFTGELTLDENGTASLRAETHFGGEAGLRFSEQVRELQADQRGLVARNIAAQTFSGWQVAEASLSGLEPGQRLVNIAKLQRRAALEPVGNRRLLRIPIVSNDFTDRLGDRPERKLPVQIVDLMHAEWDIVVKPGPHFRAIEVPDTLRVRDELIDFELAYRLLDDGSIRITQRVSIRPGRFAASRWSDWLTLLRRLDLAEQANLVFVPTSD